MQLLLALLLTTSPKAGLPAELPLPSEARKHQHAPAVRMMYQWDEVTPESQRGNKEAWTNFVLQRKLTLPTEMLMSDKPEPMWANWRDDPRTYTEVNHPYIHRRMQLKPWPRSIRLHSPWLAAIDCRMPSFHTVDMLVRYTVHQEPSGLNQYYSGSVDSVPHLTARAKTIEALEAKLLEMYCDYITRLLEDDLQPEVSPPPETKPSFTIADGRNN